MSTSHVHFLTCGYAFERVAELTGSYAVAGFVTAVLAFVVSGTALTLFFVWRQDILANTVAHAAIDAVGPTPCLSTRLQTAEW
jgi:hypothetical protein